MVIEESPKPYVNPDRFRLMVQAEGLGRYAIDVSLPPKRAEGETFPVILVVDGNWHFDTVQVIVHGSFVTDWSWLPPAIVVGVGYPADEGFASAYARRNFDFHGDWDMADESGQLLHQIFDGSRIAEGKPELEMKAGGAPRFSEFLRNELLPELAHHYPIDLAAKHTLIGHSSGGHYVLRAIFDPNSPFSRYLALSPSLGAAAGTIQALEADYAAAHDDLKANVFVACGREEAAGNRAYALGSVGGGVLWTAEQFAYRGWKSAYLDWEIMDHEDHASCLPRAIAAGLRSVFRKRPGIDAGALLPYSADQEVDPMFSIADAANSGRSR